MSEISLSISSLSEASTITVSFSVSSGSVSSVSIGGALVSVVSDVSEMTISVSSGCVSSDSAVYSTSLSTVSSVCSVSSCSSISAVSEASVSIVTVSAGSLISSARTVLKGAMGLKIMKAARTPDTILFLILIVVFTSFRIF